MSFEGDLLTDEQSMEGFNKPAKEMYDKFYSLLTELGMTKENALRACNIGSAYFDIFDYKNKSDELSEKGMNTLNNWKEDFGNKYKEIEFINWLLRN